MAGNVYIICMGSSKDFKNHLAEQGLTHLAARLSAETGYKFSAQQLNHWKTRGVPYRWVDIVSQISELPKETLRVDDPK
jgi:hypothetical protein